MAEAFASDCVTRVDTLVSRWFPEPVAVASLAAPPAALPTPVVTLVRPREVSAIFVVGVGLAAALLAVIAMQLWVQAG